MQFLLLSLASLAVAAPIFDYAPAHDNDQSHGPHDQHDIPLPAISGEHDDLPVPDLPLTSGSGLPSIGSESGALPIPHLPAVGMPGTSHALPFPEPHHESPLPLGPNFELPHSVGSADGGLPVPVSSVSHGLPIAGAEGALPAVSHGVPEVQPGNIVGTGAGAVSASPASTVLTPAGQALGSIEGSVTGTGPVSTGGKPDISAPLVNVEGGKALGNDGVSGNLPIGDVANVKGSASGQGKAASETPEVSGDLVDAQTNNGLVSGKMSASENDGFSAGASGVGNASFMGGESVSGQGSASGNGAASVSGAMSGSAATSGAQASSGKGDVSGSAAASGIKSAGDKPVGNTAEPYSPLISL